jgi:hypothetical protein
MKRIILSLGLLGMTTLGIYRSVQNYPQAPVVWECDTDFDCGMRITDTPKLVADKVWI